MPKYTVKVALVYHKEISVFANRHADVCFLKTVPRGKK